MMALKALLLGLLFVGMIVAQECPASCSEHGQCGQNGICYCNPNYEGDDCSIFNQRIAAGQAYNNSVPMHEWRYYTLVTGLYETITWTLERTSEEGDADLYLRTNDFPNRLQFENRNISSNEVVTIVRENAEPGTYIVGVWGYRACTFSLRADYASPCPNDCNSHGRCSTLSGTCECYTNWLGEDCSIQVVSPGVEYPGFVNDLFEWVYFAFVPDVLTVYDAIEWKVTPVDERDHSCQIYTNMNAPPSLFEWDQTEVGNTGEPITLQESEIVAGNTYYMGVNGMFGLRHCNFTASAQFVTPDVPTECPNNCSFHSDSCQQNKCFCTNGFDGDECEDYLPNLEIGQTMTGYAGDGAWNYYHFEGATTNALKVTLTRTAPTGDVDLYVNEGSMPTRFNYSYCDFNGNVEMQVTIFEPLGSVWYIGVFGWSGSNYSLVVEDETTCDCVHGNCYPAGTTQCECFPGWSGDLCDYPVKYLNSGVPVVNEVVAQDMWNYYALNVSLASAVSITVAEHGEVGVAWVFVNYDVFPTTTDYAYNDKNHHDSKHQISYHTKEEESGELYIGVYGSPFIPEIDGSTNVTYDIVCWASGF